MAFEQPDRVPDLALDARIHADDGRGALALAAGLVGGLVGGGSWAGLVLFTGYEVGYAAWGVGLLVGFVMARATSNRTQQLAYAAAAFAMAGLLAGKVFIFVGSTGAVAKDYAANDEVMKNVVAWQLYDSRSLDAAILDELDATLAARDTLSDAVWDAMRVEAGIRLASMSAAERHQAATLSARSMTQGIGVVAGVKAQLSPFDLLWIFLAVGTAYRMMLAGKPEEVAAPGAQAP